MNPTKTGLYATYADDRSVLLYWDGEDWVDQDGIRPCYKKVQWTGKPFFVPALRTWVGLTDEEILRADPWMGTSDSDINPYQILLKVRILEAKLKERNT